MEHLKAEIRTETKNGNHSAFYGGDGYEEKMQQPKIPSKRNHPNNDKLDNFKLRPGIANFSGLFQQSGWLPPTLTILLCVVSSVASGESCHVDIDSSQHLTSGSPNIG